MAEVAIRVQLPGEKYFDAFGPPPDEWTADDMRDVFRAVMARAFGEGKHAFMLEYRSSADDPEMGTITITVDDRSMILGPAKFSNASIEWLVNEAKIRWTETSDERGN